MATAYTSLLGLALPVTGELSGTWGNTVNTEITSLLDSAIAGTTTISADADITLTTTTGAANESREAIILWTAGGTTTRNITAPAQSKAYIVINKSSSTQSIVLRGVGPTTGVTIIKGEAAVCAWNGTDFIKVSNTSGSGTFSNLTVTGTTTLSGLTASTALALDASKNVVSVTNTGTGNNVLATSPTLVTPALGTPSSGVVTNLTGTASININGTVGATTPTTGSFTSLAYSTTLTGGTGIVNLGSGQFYKDASGLVGIGTTTPSSYGKFAVFGTQTVSGIGNVSGFFSDGVTVSLYILNQGTIATLQSDASLAFGSLNTERMRINTSGNVGIGTTSPSEKLEVAGAAKLTNGNLSIAPSTATQAAVTICTNTGGSFFAGLDSSTGSTFGVGNYSAVLYNGANTPLVMFTNATERMRIESSGNVGIGTTSPAARLQVNAATDTIKTLGTSYNQQLYDCSAGFSQAVWQYIGVSKALINASASGMLINTAADATAPMVFGTGSGSTERMRIDSSGNVGIGTSSPSVLLNVSSASQDGGKILIQSGTLADNNRATLFMSSQNVNGQTGNVSIECIHPNNQQSDMVFRTGATDATSFGTERMRINTSGNVGIGNTAPPTGVRLTSTAPSASGYNLFLEQDNGLDGYLLACTSTAGALTFSRRDTSGTNTSEKMRIDSSGNLIVGNTTAYGIINGYTAQGGTQLSVLHGGAGSYPKVSGISFGQTTTSITVSNNGGTTAFTGGAGIYANNTASSGNPTSLVFWTNSSGTPTEAMRIDSSGNVGIGTASPVTNLNISSASAATGGDSTQYVQTTYTGTGTVNSGYTAKNYYGTSQFFQWNNNGTRLGNRIITNAGVGALVFTYGNDTEGMRIDSAGRVGIGTASPSQRFVVSEAGANNIVMAENSAASIQLYMQATSSTGALGTLTNHALNFLTNNTERMRIDASGSVVIGSTVANGRFSVTPSSNPTTLATSTTITLNETTNNAAYQLRMAYSFLSSVYTGVIDAVQNSLGAPLALNPTGGNVGIGTTTPVAKLAVVGGTSNASSLATAYSLAAFNITPKSTSGYSLQFGSGPSDLPYIQMSAGGSSAGDLLIQPFGGNVLVGTTTSSAKFNVVSSGDVVYFETSGSTATCSYFKVPGTTAFYCLFQNSSGTNIGSIRTTDGTTVQYNTSSDYRLKDNVAPMTGALARVASLKPCTYTWKSTGQASQGFIAHELQAVVPECVSGEKDAVDADGKPVHQGVDTSFLVATLTAAIQELKAEFDAYKSTHP